MGRDRSTTGLVPAYVEAGKIVTVDPVAWTCTVVSETTQRTFYNCLIGAPYLHYRGGEGLSVMPEIGAAVWVCEPSEGDARPFILAFRPQHDNYGSHRAGRGMHNPGDLSLVTRDGNGVKARRGGVTEVGSTAICRRFYLPIGNIIHDVAENYLLDTFGGEIKWSVLREEEDPDGHKATQFSSYFKEFADDASYVARVQVGGGVEEAAGVPAIAPVTPEVATTPVVRVRIYEDGNVADPQTSMSMAVAKDGTVEVATKGAFVVEVRGDKNVTLSFNPDGTVTLDADTSVVVTADGLPVTHTGQKVTVGTGTAPVLYDNGFSADAAAAWATVSTIAKVLGIPTESVDQHIAALTAQGYTAKKLETD